jgi:DNA repair exonuclease SbcCD nuclease subunit
MRAVFCADLHLAEKEKDYSFGVLREVTALCGGEGCDYLLLGGDIFNSRPDAESLRGAFAGILEDLPPECTVYYLPGNHEELYKPANAAPFENLSFGRAEVLFGRPYSVKSLGAGAELLALPFQRDYSDYRSWPLPPGEKELRIVMAHGTVPGISYTGPGEEDPAGVLDPDIFSCFNAGLALLGHIHGSVRRQMGETLVAYPGSARVWREAESGARQVFLIDTKAKPFSMETLKLKSAGEYRSTAVYAAPDGELRISGKMETWSAEDWICLEVSGFVEDERKALENLEILKGALEKKFRRVTLTNRISVLAGISNHPLALAFLKKWETLAASSSGPERDIYNLARLKGLEVLKDILENRR